MYMCLSSKMCAGPMRRPVRAGPCCPAGSLTTRRGAVLSLSTAAAEATGITLTQRSTVCLSAAASVSPPPPSTAAKPQPVFVSNPRFYSPSFRAVHWPPDARCVCVCFPPRRSLPVGFIPGQPFLRRLSVTNKCLCTKNRLIPCRAPTRSSVLCLFSFAVTLCLLPVSFYLEMHFSSDCWTYIRLQSWRCLS